MTLALSGVIIAIGIAIGIAAGIGIGFSIFANTSAGLERQVQEQSSKIAALESELKTTNERYAALEEQQKANIDSMMKSGMRSMDSDAPVAVPSVKGFYNGQEILFIHTEASDTQVASMLTMMMNSPVILVPSLKDIPTSSLGDVYVFTNGVEGDGPFGFQPDVFSSVPNDKDYSPLRAVKLVSWKDASTVRELRSVEEIKVAEVKDELTVSAPGIMVNMPIVKWPAGQR